MIVLINKFCLGNNFTAEDKEELSTAQNNESLQQKIHKDSESYEEVRYSSLY